MGMGGVLSLEGYRDGLWWVDGLGRMFDSCI